MYMFTDTYTVAAKNSLVIACRHGLVPAQLRATDDALARRCAR
jgi:hypothetical protein